MQEIRLTSRGQGLAARVYGPPDGVPVLALHGWLDNAATFDCVASLLPWARVVALDLPGHGLSVHRPAGATYEMIEWVPEVFRATDALGWTQFHLLGHSMGGAVASLAAGTFPDRVRGLMLVDALGALTAPASAAPTRLAQHVIAAARLEGKAAPRYESFEAALTARVRAGDFESDAGIRAVVERGLESLEEGGKKVYRWRSDPRLTLPSALRLTPDQVAAFLQLITCPVLLVRPLGGLVEVGKELDAFVPVVKNLEVQKIEGRHHVHLDRPDAVAALFNDFYARRLKSPR